MQEGSSGRSSQSRHDGEKGERQEETREARGPRECPSAGSWDWGWGNAPVQAAGIGDGEGSNLDGKGKGPFRPQIKTAYQTFHTTVSLPFEKSLGSRYSQTQPYSLGRVWQPD